MKPQRSFGWIPFSLLLSLPALAGQPITLRAEKTFGDFQAQQALVFSPTEVTMIRNSNFICPPEEEVRLGSFHSEAVERTQHYPVAQALRTGPELAENRKPQALDLTPRLFLNQTEIKAQQSKAYGEVLKMLEAGCTGKDWEVKQGASIRVQRLQGDVALKITEIRTDVPGKSTFLTLDKAGCKTPSPGVLECRIPEHGVARLKNPF